MGEYNELRLYYPNYAGSHFLFNHQKNCPVRSPELNIMQNLKSYRTKQKEPSKVMVLSV